MAGMLRVSRSRGAFSGALLVLLGIWGGLIPFVGPYVHYAYTPDRAWTWSSGRLWLSVLPGAATLLGGVMVGLSRLRPVALFGAGLAVLAGAWFAAGSVLTPLWTSAQLAGTPVGGQVARVLEQIGFFTGLGVVVVCVASVALGRLALVSVRDARRVSDAETAREQAATVAAAETPTTPTRFRPTMPTPFTRVGRVSRSGDKGAETETAPKGESVGSGVKG
jgi:hypothetical protein